MPRPKPRPADDSGELFPIRTVSHLTGVNSVTLRAWERRHGLIKPQRTQSGHRLYGPAQIEVIHRILGLLEKGLPISQVERALAAPGAERAGAEQGPWNSYRERIIGAVARYDDDELEVVYSQALSLYPIEMVTDRLLLPVLQELGRRWKSGEGSVAEEHFFSIYVRNKLGARFHHRARTKTGPRILAACFPNEQHELGLLIFSLAAHERGMRIVMLAAQTPLEDLPLAARRARCDAIVLSSTVTPPEGVIANSLPAMVAAASVPVFVGGLASLRERDGIVAAGAEVLGTDISSAVERIRLSLGDVVAH
jgi:MerR family transcriptional regulator, light-induced transcriptional regulator